MLRVSLEMGQLSGRRDVLQIRAGRSLGKEPFMLPSSEKAARP